MDLEQAVDRVLFDMLPKGMADAINEALAKGASPASILQRIRRRAAPQSLIALACEAYLEQKGVKP